MALVVIGAALYWLLIGRKITTVIPSKNPASSSSSKPKSDTTSTNPSSNTSGQSASGTSGKEQSQTQTSSGNLKSPYGDFVSNHAPGQNGSTTAESSTCITTPGASCYIKLTQGNETKLLDTRITDTTGTAYWSWDAGTLSSGAWTITAVATLNGQTKSVQDSMPLTVQ